MRVAGESWDGAPFYPARAAADPRHGSLAPAGGARPRAYERDARGVGARRRSDRKRFPPGGAQPRPLRRVLWA